MGGEYDRGRAVGELAQVGDQLRAGDGVEAGGRLVEEEEVRVGEQLDGDAGPFALTAAQRADPDVDLPGQAHGVDGVTDGVVHLGPGCRRREPEARRVAKRTLERQVGMDDVLLGHVAEHVAECPRVGVDVDAVEMHRARRRSRGEAGDRLQQGCLAGAAGTDDRHQLTSREGERHGVEERHLAPVADPDPAGQVVDVDADTSGWKAGQGRQGGFRSSVERCDSIFCIRCGHGSSSGGHAFSIGRESDRSWVDFCRSFRPGTESNLGRGPVSWAAPSGAGPPDR